jgi:formylglycine-generating enzyme required for sulfatase activity
MPRIFISYRRADSAGWVTAIYKELIEHFDPQDIFRDITTIDYGVDFVETIEQAVQQCDVLLAIIGPQWQTITDQSGKRRRLENPNDFVRLEIVTALNRNVRVIPVLVGGAIMPYENEMPDDLRALCRRNALEIGDRDFDHHMQQLIGVLQRIEKTPVSVPKLVPPNMKNILPIPFEWIEISAGAVVLEDASRMEPPGTKGGEYHVPIFAIAQYPITNAQYNVFVDDTNGYKASNWWEYSNEAKDWHKRDPQPEKSSSKGKNMPRTNVCWYEAMAFCLWLSRKTGQNITLPSEQQWQRAAQGDDGRLYPWGNLFDNDKCNTWDSRIEEATDVTQFPMGESPFGVMDMSGNVWEWCLNEWKSGQTVLLGHTRRVVRGGSWANDSQLARITVRFSNYPALRNYDRGFRIVCVAE